MSVEVKLPETLRRATGAAQVEEVAGSNVLECLLALTDRYPDLKSMVFDPTGELLLNWTVYKNNCLISSAAILQCPLGEGDEITLIPLVAGG